MLPPIESSASTSTNVRAAPSEGPQIQTPQDAIDRATQDNGLFGAGHADTQANLEASREQAVSQATDTGDFGAVLQINRAYAQARVVLDVRDALSHQADIEGGTNPDAVESNLGDLANAMTLLADGAESLAPEDAVAVIGLVGAEIADVEQGNELFSADANVTILEQTGRVAMVAQEAGDHELFDALVSRSASSSGLLQVTANEQVGDAIASLDPDIALDTLPFYLALGADAHAAGDDNPYGVVQTVLTDFVSGAVGDEVGAFVTHSEELQFLIANAGSNATPEALAGAVNRYVLDQSPGWREEYNDGRAQVASQGERLLDAIAQIGKQVPAGERNALLEGVVQSPDAQFAIRTALDADPALATDPKVVEARNALADGAELGTNTFVVASLLGTAYLQRSVSGALDAGINASGNPDPRAMLAQLQGLRDPGLAQSLGISPDVLDGAIDKLETLNAEIDAGNVRTPAELRAFIDTEVRGDLRVSQAFEPNTPIGRVFGGLTGVLAAVSLVYATGDTIKDPSVSGFVAASASALALGQQGAQLIAGTGALSNSGLLAQFAGNADFANLLGAVAVGLSAYAAGDAFANGDPLQGSLQTASALGGAVSLFRAGSAFGVWGTVIGTAAAVGSLGVSIHRQREEANKYETDAAERFVEALGYSGKAADLLTDNAGNGASPMPVLTRWAAEDGLTPEQTVRFINDLVERDGGADVLSSLRDGVHDGLEANEGDPASIESSDGYNEADRLEFGRLATIWQNEHAAEYQDVG